MANQTVTEEAVVRERGRRMGSAERRGRTRPGSLIQRSLDQIGGTDRAARGLGWFSIGLGLAEVLAPGMIAGICGVRRRRGLIRLYGLRELAAGAGILAGEKPAGWLWARVGGDVIDLASLAAGLRANRRTRGRILAAATAVAGVTALDVVCARDLSISSGLLAGGEQELRVSQSIIVNRSPEDCYGFWRDLGNLPRIMTHLNSVYAIGDNRTHWVAQAPGDSKVEWDSEIVEDRPNEVIAWRSLEGADVDNAGSVRFEGAPGGRGTIVKLSIYYMPPDRGLGSMVARLLGQDPAQQIARGLRRFKQLLETGEIATTEGQPAGRPNSLTHLDRLARS